MRNLFSTAAMLSCLCYFSNKVNKSNSNMEWNMIFQWLHTNEFKDVWRNVVICNSIRTHWTSAVVEYLVYGQLLRIIRRGAAVGTTEHAIRLPSHIIMIRANPGQPHSCLKCRNQSFFDNEERKKNNRWALGAWTVAPSWLMYWWQSHCAS